MYLTDEQRDRIARRAKDAGVSQAEVIRRILDEALGLGDDVDQRVRAVEDTAGLLEDHADWPDWLAEVRGRSLRRFRRSYSGIDLVDHVSPRRPT